MVGLIDLHSEEGQSLWNQCLKSGTTVQAILHAIFRKQIGHSNCGIQSAALVMASEKLGLKYNPMPASDTKLNISVSEQPIIEENMFNYEATTNVVTQAYVDEHGTTLEQVSRVLQGHGYKVKCVFAEEVNVDVFKKDAIDVLTKTNSAAGIIVNYHMPTLGQHPPYGHHSPLAAYHKETDRFLLMDTWSETKECWATSEDLYKAMNTVDSDSKRSRGYCIIHN